MLALLFVQDLHAKVRTIKIKARKVTVDHVPELKTVGDFMNRPTLHDYQPRVEEFSSSRKQKYWALVAEPSSGDDVNSRLIVAIWVTKLPQRESAMELCRLLVDALNRFPSADQVTLPYSSLTRTQGKRHSVLPTGPGPICMGFMNAIYEAVASQPPFNLLPAPKFVKVPSISKDGKAFRLTGFFRCCTEDFSENYVRRTRINFKEPPVFSHAQLPPPTRVRYCLGTRDRYPTEAELIPIMTNEDGSQGHDLRGIDDGRLAGLPQDWVLDQYKLVMLIIANLHNTVIPKNEVHLHTQYLLESHGFSGVGGTWGHTGFRSNLRWWGGKRFVIMHRSRANLRYSLRASPALKRDITLGRFPGLCIRTLDASRLVAPLNACRNVLVQLGDAREAWLALAQGLEEEKRKIRDGVLPSSICVCDPADLKAKCIHHCASCGVQLDSDLLEVGMDGLRECASCIIAMAKGQTSGNMKPLRDVVLAARLFKSVIKERPKDYKPLYEASLAYIISRQPQHRRGTIFRDEYRQLDVHIDTDIDYGRLSRDPFGPSVDSIWPYVRHNDGYELKHVPGNLAVTICAFNLAKLYWIPALLQFVQQFVTGLDHVKAKYNEMSPDSARHMRIQVANLEEKIIQQCSTVAMLCIKAHIQARHYQKHGFDYAKVDFDKQEWLAAKLRDDKGPWQHSKFHTQMPKTLRENKRYNQDNLQRLFSQIAAEFGVDLVTGTDGCPWWGHPTALPQSWRWGAASNLVRQRYIRMRELCNGLDLTRDTYETLWLELVFQHCVKRCQQFVDGVWSAQQKKIWAIQYAEFLNLPLVEGMKHPLAFSIGHRLHGQPMFSGWAEHPTALADRNDAENNLIVESRFSNYLKLNFLSRFYPGIQNAIRAVRLSKEFFNPDIDLDPIPDDLQPRWEDEDVDSEGLESEDEDQEWRDGESGADQDDFFKDEKPIFSDEDEFDDQSVPERAIKEENSGNPAVASEAEEERKPNLKGWVTVAEKAAKSHSNRDDTTVPDQIAKTSLHNTYTAQHLVAPDVKLEPQTRVSVNPMPDLENWQVEMEEEVQNQRASCRSDRKIMVYMAELRLATRNANRRRFIAFASFLSACLNVPELGSKARFRTSKLDDCLR